ncbi:MAG: AbrB/MazE/SpoVT family DNA-binding domain-containing protein [Xenococcaceae cyanobacterium MO_234.B1]|nr:AbrB/MazE/SpoVT family DNA-binding domain-containing protein [Xenococcaceae cyanobacterium MO_234.B1]
MRMPKTKLTSKVTQKYQATIPQAVRKKLGIEKGDRVTFEIEDEKVILKKVSSVDWEYLESVSATLSEWSSDADEEAYRDL